ncbi:MAG: sialate O-acetylesterase, partial [Haloferula sp.]
MRLSILVLPVMAAFAASSVSAADPIRVFLFAGQSNMEGADTRVEEVDSHPPYRGVFGDVDEVRYSYQLGQNHQSDGWTTLNVAGNMFGPEITFARELLEDDMGPIAIIKDAWGGTTLVNDWAPDGGDDKSRKLYARFVKQVEHRLADLKDAGETYQVEALMWHQGENDMFHAEGKQSYEENLAGFIASLRRDLKLPELKVFVGEISTKGVWGMDNRANVALIRDAQDAVVKADPLVNFVPTS